MLPARAAADASAPTLSPRPAAGDAPVTVAAGAERGERLLLAAVVLLQLLPLLLLPRIPTQDGPSHQALAYAMRVLERPEGAPLRVYLERNPEALPNWFVFFLQADVLRPLSTGAAEKVLLAAYVVLLPLGLRYAVRAVRPDAGYLAALALPFTYSYMATMGFLNFCWSLAAFLFALGFYLRRRERFAAAGTAARDLAATTLLVLWVYFCHPVTLVMLLGAVGVLALADAVTAWRAAGDGGARLRAAAARLVLPLLPFAPALALLALFVGQRLHRHTSSMPFLVKLRQLLALYTLVSLDRRTLVVAVGTALLLAVLAALVLRQRLRDGWSPRWEPLLGVLAAFVVVYFLAPSELAGGGFLVHRLELFPPLVLALWIASAPLGRRVRLAVPLVAAALALGQLALLGARWARLDALVGEIVAVVERVPDGATLLPLGFAPAGPENGELAFRTWPFVHVAGYVAGRRPVVDLGLYEASEDYFPLRFRRALDPYLHLGVTRTGIEDVPPFVDIPRYEALGGRVDYVLLTFPAAADPRHPWVGYLRRQLAGGYVRVAVSSHGNAELWQRRGTARG